MTSDKNVLILKTSVMVMVMEETKTWGIRNFTDIFAVVAVTVGGFFNGLFNHKQQDMGRRVAMKLELKRPA